MLNGKEAVVAVQTAAAAAAAATAAVAVGKDALVDSVVEDAIADDSPFSAGAVQAVEAVCAADTCVADVRCSWRALRGRGLTMRR